MQFETWNTDRHSTVELREQVRQIPSTMAQLVFIAGLRDLNSGLYRSPMGSKAGGADADRVLRRIHEELFSAWLNYRLEEQKADLDLYFSCVDCERAVAMQNWLRLESYRSLVPVSASSPERQLFYTDLEMLLRLMANDASGVAAHVKLSAPNDEILIPAESICLQSTPFQHSGASQCPIPLCTLRCCHPGPLGLSAREKQVLHLIGEGNVTKEIAAALSIHPTTVAVYRKRICKKLDLHSTSELAACAAGWLSGRCRHTAVY